MNTTEMRTTQRIAIDVDPLVMLAEAPGAVLERAACAQPEDHRQDERDVETRRPDRGSDVVPGEVVPIGRHEQQEPERADGEAGEHRHTVARHVAPGLVPGNGTVAREREHHPRPRRDACGEAVELCNDDDEEEKLCPVRAHRRLPDPRHDVAVMGLDGRLIAGWRTSQPSSRMKPAITETTTAQIIPVAAERDAACVSSAMCAEAS